MSPKRLPTLGWLCLLLFVVMLSGCPDLQTSDVRRAAQRVSSRNNIKQLTLALLQFHEDQQRWPDQLTELLPILDGNTSVLSNPITGDEPGYDYVKPSISPDSSLASRTVVIYQMRRGKRDTDLDVGYLDGSVKLLSVKN